MAFTRANSVAYLTAEFADLAEDTGIATNDTAAGYGGIVDSALLEYGAGFSSLSSASVADADVIPFRALLRYFAFRRFSQILVKRVDIYTEHPSPDARRSQAVRNLMHLMNDAKAECVSYGYLADTPARDDGGVFTRMTLSLDSVEPYDASL